MKKLLAFLLAMVMVFALCACGGSDDTADTTAEEPVAAAAEPAAEPAAAADTAAAPAEEAAEAPAGDASGEMGGASGDASDAPDAVETVVPDAKYSKDFEGYRSYVIDAFAGDDHAPDDVKETTNANLQAATDENDDSFAMLVDAGLVVTYADFLAN